MKRKIKTIFKLLTYKIFNSLVIKNSISLSDFFISLGYAIKNEALFKYCEATKVDWFKLDRLEMHKELAEKLIGNDNKIIYLEFGVFWGQTFELWTNNNTNPDSFFVGFDTFSGLPEDWGNIKKGSFSAQGELPNIKDPRCSFQVGLIQDTLPLFLKDFSKGTKKVIHIDVDLYNASLITLINLNPYLEKDDIIIFDDFFTITKAKFEYRSYLDYLSLYETKLIPILCNRNGHFVAKVG
jgi:O-methyltransferase